MLTATHRAGCREQSVWDPRLLLQETFQIRHLRAHTAARTSKAALHALQVVSRHHYNRATMGRP